MEIPVDIAVRLLQAETAIAEMQRLGRATDKTAKKTGKMGGAARKLGFTIGALTGGFTALAVSMQSIALARDFESSLTKMNTLVGVQKGQIKAWQSDIEELSLVSGKNLVELADSMFFITSAGQKGEAALEALEYAAKAAAIGLGDTVAVADATTSAMNAYSKSGMTAAEATDTLVSIVREGKVAAEELAPALGRAIGVASGLGVSFQDLGAFIATYTRLGVPAAEAVTAVRATLLQLTTTTKKQEEAALRLGVSFKDIRRTMTEEGLLQGLQKMAKAIEGNADAFFELFPNVRASAGVLGTIGSQAEEYAEIQARMRESMGLTENGFKEWEKTAEAASLKMSAAFESLKLALGNELAPAMAEVSKFLTEMAGDDSVREFFGSIGAKGAEALRSFGKALKFVVDNFDELKAIAIVFIGLKLLYTFERMGFLALDLAAAYRAVQIELGGVVAAKAGVEGVTGAMTMLGRATKLALGPVGLITIAFSGLMLLVDKYTDHIDKLHRQMMETIHKEQAQTKTLSDLTMAFAQVKRAAEQSVLGFEGMDDSLKLDVTYVKVAERELESLKNQVESAENSLKALKDEAGGEVTRVRTTGGDFIEYEKPPSEEYLTAANNLNILNQRYEGLKNLMKSPIFLDARKRLEELGEAADVTAGEGDGEGVGGLADEVKELEAAFLRSAKEAVMLAEALGKGEEEFEAANRLIQVQNAILSKGIDLTSEEGKRLLELGLAAAEASAGVDELREAQEKANEELSATKAIKDQIKWMAKLTDAFESGALNVGIADLEAMREAISSLEDPTMAEIQAWVDLRRESREAVDDFETLLREKAIAALDDYIIALKLAIEVSQAMGDTSGASMFTAALQSVENIRDEISGVNSDMKKDTKKTLTESEQLWKNYTENVQKAFGESIGEMLKGNIDSWQDFFDTIYEMFVDLLAQMVAKALTEKIVLGGLDLGEGGGGGNPFKEMKDFFGGLNKMMRGNRAQGAPGMAGGGGSGGMQGAFGAAMVGIGLGGMVGGMVGDSTGGAIGGAIGAAIGNAILPVVGGYIGAVLGGIVGGLLGKKKTPKGFAELAVKDGLAQVGDVSGKLSTQAREIGEGITDAVNDIVSALGGELVGVLGDISLRMKGEDIMVDLGGAIKNFGDDVEAAVQYAIVEMLRRADLSGVSDTVVAALRNTSASTVQELQRDIQTAQSIDALVSGEVRARVEKAFTELVALLESAARLGVDAATRAEAMRNGMESLRDEILGITREDFGQRLFSALDFNEKLGGLTDSLGERRAEIEAKIAEIEAQMAELPRVISGRLDRVDEDLNVDQSWGEYGKLQKELERLKGTLDGLADVDPIEVFGFAEKLIAEFAGLGDMASEVESIKLSAMDMMSALDEMFEQGLIDADQLADLQGQIADAEARRLQELQVDAFGGLIDLMQRAGMDEKEIMRRRAELAQMQFRLDMERIKADLEALNLTHQLTEEQAKLFGQFEEFASDLDNFVVEVESATDRMSQQINAFDSLISLMKQAGLNQEEIMQREMEVAQLKFKLELELVTEQLKALSATGELTAEQANIIDQLRAFAGDLDNFRGESSIYNKHMAEQERLLKEQVEQQKRTADLIASTTEERFDYQRDLIDMLSAAKGIWELGLADRGDTWTVLGSQVDRIIGDWTATIFTTLNAIVDRWEEFTSAGGNDAIRWMMEALAEGEIAELIRDLGDAITGLTSAGAAGLAIRNQLNLITDLNAALDMLDDPDAIATLIEQFPELAAVLESFGGDVQALRDYLEDQEELLRLELETDVLSSLFSVFKESGKYADKRLELEKMEFELQMGVIKAQLMALDLWLQYEDIWNEAMQEGLDQIEDSFDNAAGSLKDAIESLRDYRESLSGGPETDETRQFFAARSRFNQLAARAMTGDQDALRELSSAHRDMVNNMSGLSQGMASTLYSESVAMLDRILAMFNDDPALAGSSDDATANAVASSAATISAAIEAQTNTLVAKLEDQSDILDRLLNAVDPVDIIDALEDIYRENTAARVVLEEIRARWEAANVA